MLKRYDIDLIQFGRRIADLLIKVGNGHGLNVAKQVLEKY